MYSGSSVPVAVSCCKMAAYGACRMRVCVCCVCVCVVCSIYAVERTAQMRQVQTHAINELTRIPALVSNLSIVLSAAVLHCTILLLY